MKNNIFAVSLVAVMVASGAHAGAELTQAVQPQTTVEAPKTQKTFAQSAKDLGNSALKAVSNNKGTTAAAVAIFAAVYDIYKYKKSSGKKGFFAAAKKKLWK